MLLNSCNEHNFACTFPLLTLKVSPCSTRASFHETIPPSLHLSLLVPGLLINTRLGSGKIHSWNKKRCKFLDEIYHAWFQSGGLGAGQPHQPWSCFFPSESRCPPDKNIHKYTFTIQNWEFFGIFGQKGGGFGQSNPKTPYQKKLGWSKSQWGGGLGIAGDGEQRLAPTLWDLPPLSLRSRFQSCLAAGLPPRHNCAAVKNRFT